MPKKALDVTQPPKAAHVRAAYKLARERFAALGVDADQAMRAALAIPISVQCWQADDVRGLEVHEGAVDSGGLQATGNYPGAARNGDEIRADFDAAAALIPGKLRFNIHAMYAETGGRRVDRDELEPKHFARWIDWSKARRRGLDFNPTLFAHPMVKDGLTLSSSDDAARAFWIRHCLATRRIANAIGKALGSPCINNIWIPDGRKDSAVDRMGPRHRLLHALDEVLDRKLPHVVDAVESKLFGIGCEDYTVGSHEFYLAYAATRGVALCYDLGHFHPTESVADKLSATLLFVDKLLIHASRGIRWDSDHVVRFTDELRAVCDEAVRSGALGDILWALDYFDASINRVAAWVIGARALRKALLYALIEPFEAIAGREEAGNGAAKLALVEHRAELPFAAVWDYACLWADVPVGAAWLRDVAAYEIHARGERG
ncbi:MAG TPA: L-rhamnose isomerase [Planctomycetota bacterium]|nr:L-rhamnose isomerase [Planctomycetota bacterium]HRR78889.1 L-rhamnose isomerase [Planctomycetota bacterium]HRT93908.1 L-rhamnose isomerase [Planctomycetota bacterium]